MSKKMKDVILAAIFMLFGIGIAIYAYGYRTSRPPYGYDLGDWWLPFWCAALIAVLSAYLIIKALLNKDAAYSEKKPVDLSEKTSLIKGCLTVILLFAYVISFQKLGFLISSIMYLFLQFIILSTKDKRNWKVIAAVAIGLPALVYVLFEYVFNYILPAGVLG